MRTFILILAASVGMFAGACDVFDAQKCPEDTERWTEYQLYMGRGGPGGEFVDDTEWEAFLSDTVTPRFPDGLTVLDGKGQWRGSDGMIQKESSKVLIILVPREDDGAGDLIAEVSEEYKRRFDQESVLETVSKTCVGLR